MAVESGGSSTINGVLYQMLWTLLNAVEICLKSDVESDSDASTYLILEPSGGGGDLQRNEVGKRRVQQVKARTNNQTWSLTDIVKDVLPDLYKAVEVDQKNDSYEFITEGPCGDWKQVETFFIGMQLRLHSSLDPNKTVAFAHHTSGETPFFPNKSYTEKTLFDKIVSHLKQKNESRIEAENKVWHLLSHFTCHWNKKIQMLEERIDRFLLEVVDYAEDVPQKRIQLISILAHKATVAGTTISAAQLFEECGLSQIRLSNWQKYLVSSRELLHGEAERRNYDANSDVRPRNKILPTKPIIVFSGESGSGKSWHLLSTALYLSQTSVVAFCAASGSADGDMQKASQIFWEEIGDHDQSILLSRISRRLRDTEAVPARRWLYLCLDNLQNLEEAKNLTTQDFEGWGVCLIVTAPPHIAEKLKEHANDRVEVIEVGDFSEEEMRQYLTGSDTKAWLAIPRDVQDTFRRPLLASLYRQIASASGWVPENEYMLYDRWWNALRNGREVSATSLVRLSLSRLRGGNYPWRAQQLQNAGLDQNATNDLVQHGGLQRTAEGNFLIWHDRLLNWLAAEGLVEDWLHGTLSQEDLCIQIANLFQQTQENIFGYVTLDVIWILLTRFSHQEEVIDNIFDALATINAGHWSAGDSLFENLLPTLGVSVAPAMIRYLLRHQGDRNLFSVRQALVSGLAQFNSEDIAPQVKFLLAQPSQEVLHLAIRLLSQSPHFSHLDNLWQISCELHLHPDRFVEEAEANGWARWLPFGLYKALKACVALDPQWLEDAIYRADATQEPVHDLAYLLATLYNERERWLRCKPFLLEKVVPSKQRAIASNIYTHQDKTEIEWLCSHVAVAEDSLGTYALRALSRLAPDRAARAVADLGGVELYLTRSWCLRGLLLRRPEGTHAHLWDRLTDDFESVIRSFQGQEDWMTIAIVDWLLDHAETALKGNNLEDAWLFIKTLAGVSRLTLLERFEARQGTLLEERLTVLLAANPRPSLWQETVSREPAIAVLYKIGGEGFTQVINAWLNAPHRYGRYDAFEVAFKRPNADTKQILSDLTKDKKDAEVSSEDTEHDAYFAMQVLAKIHEWAPVLNFTLSHVMELIPKDVSAESGSSICLLDAMMANVFNTFKEHNGFHAGAILALGLGGRSDYLKQIVQVLENAAIESDIARAATITLTLLDDPEGQATDILAQRLANNQSSFAATNALLRNPNQRALQALLKHLQVQFGAELASILLGFPETRVSALSEIRSDLQRPHFGERVFMSLESHNEHKAVEELLTPDLKQEIENQAFAPEGGIWSAGSKDGYIYALSNFNPELAFQAAMLALSDPKSHDRERYPYRLVAIDKAQAVNALFEVMDKQDSFVLTASIGRALADAPDENRIVIMQEMQNISEQRRKTACRFAAYQPVNEELTKSVKTCLDDWHIEVVQAAEETLWQIQRNIWCDELMEAFASEKSVDRKWRLLDAALSLGDPGDEQQYWPFWLAKHCEGLSYVWHDYIGSVIKKRREEVLKALQDADKQKDS